MQKSQDKTKTIGEQIREARESQDVTQVALAHAVGVSQPSISAIESGESYPAFSTLDAICRFLELSLSLAPNARKKSNSRRNS